MTIGFHNPTDIQELEIETIRTSIVLYKIYCLKENFSQPTHPDISRRYSLKKKIERKEYRTIGTSWRFI